MANPNNDLRRICDQLKNALYSVFDRDYPVKPVEKWIDELVNGFRHISSDDAAIILRTIINPYGTRCIEHSSLRLAIKMVKFMEWWLRTKPTNAPSKGLIELVRKRHIIAFVRSPNGQYSPKLVYSAFKRFFDHNKHSNLILIWLIVRYKLRLSTSNT
jgi:hypothetical protein